jgi:hypothetical protein
MSAIQLPKFCPRISTTSMRYVEAMVQGEAAAQPGLNLQGLKGVPGASAPGKTVLGAKVILVPQIRPPDDYDASKGPLDIKDAKIVPEALSAPCAKIMCEGWCEQHECCKALGGCNECQLEIMTKAFTSALSNVEVSGLAAARGLLNRATENFEENMEGIQE